MEEHPLIVDATAAAGSSAVVVRPPSWTTCTLHVLQPLRERFRVGLCVHLSLTSVLALHRGRWAFQEASREVCLARPVLLQSLTLACLPLVLGSQLVVL